MHVIYSQHLIQSSFRSSVSSKARSSVRSQSPAPQEGPYPSSKPRKSAAEPESLDMKINLPTGTPAFINFWAQMIGPTALVCRCSEKASKELNYSAGAKGGRSIGRALHLCGSLTQSGGIHSTKIKPDVHWDTSRSQH